MHSLLQPALVYSEHSPRSDPHRPWLKRKATTRRCCRTITTPKADSIGDRGLRRLRRPQNKSALFLLS
jgi:hypothetical protein